MMQAQMAVYLGQEKESGFTGFISEGDIFGIIEIPDGIDKEAGRAFLQRLKQSLQDLAYINLNAFDEAVMKILREHNIPSNVSLVLSLQNNNIVYLKTVGTGKVYIRRGNHFNLLLAENLSASGYVQEGDLLIYTTEHFNSLLTEKDLEKYTKHGSVHEIVDEITPVIKSNADDGTIALFMSFSSPVLAQETQEEPAKEIFEPSTSTPAKSSLLSRVQLPRLQRKTLTYGAVGIIAIILIWSVILGYQRRISGAETKKIESTKELITQKLDQAEEVSFLNMARATALIDESKADVNDLEKQGISKNKLTELRQLIDDKEKAIVKKEDKPYSEFFDLSIESKNAQGNQMTLADDTISILDKHNNAIYWLNIPKKSLTSVQSSGIGASTSIGSFEDKAYLYIPEKGVYQANETKVTKIIDNDKDWQSVKDIKLYNGNLYLLDSTNLYKYIATDNGFSNKNTYFQGSKPDLSDANSLAIDSSIYIGFSDNTVKYTSGLADDFKPEFPARVSINKIVTNADLDKVYAWDKSAGAIYIINKSGEYERSITSSILAKATDVSVYQNNAYILIGAKIYTINLE